ncbi:MAG: hypothetical protein AB7E37_05185 [Candidatus Altimarinota bacterium]
MDLNKIIEKLKSSFKDEKIKKEILDEVWYKKNIDSKIDSTGFCFVASEIIYRNTGGKNVWISKSITGEKWNLGPHRFLVNKETKEILDITSDQYTALGEEIPYEKGVNAPFHKNFSKGYKILAEKIGLSN